MWAGNIFVECGEVNMSRIGRKPIQLPSQVTAKCEKGVIFVKGPKGEKSYPLPSPFTVDLTKESIVLKGLKDGKAAKALFGAARSHIANAVKGVSEGFEKQLDIVGVGYRAQMKGRELHLSLGASHTVVMPICEGVEVKLQGMTKIIVTGMDKHKVGLVASEIRALRPPDCYKGKGIKYINEVVRIKVGKATSA